MSRRVARVAQKGLGVSLPAAARGADLGGSSSCSFVSSLFSNWLDGLESAAGVVFEGSFWA